MSSCHQILTYIENHLPLSGVLKKSGDFIYVDLDDAYIRDLIVFIEPYGFHIPPYFGSKGLVGAHITVVHPVDMQKCKLNAFKEIGEKIYFSLKTCQIVQPPRWKGIDEVYLILVDSPALDKIRQKYRLPGKEYSFHITIGVKSKVARAA